MKLRDRWHLATAIVQEWGVHAKAAWNWSNDGCTGVPDFNFRRCCELHDFAYRNGAVSRAQADKTLRQCICAHGWTFVPWLYWAGVRMFGWKAYRGQKKRGHG